LLKGFKKTLLGLLGTRGSSKHHFWTDLSCAWSFELSEFLFYFLRFTAIEVEVVWRYRFPITQRAQLLPCRFFFLSCHLRTRCCYEIIALDSATCHFKWIIDTYSFYLHLLKLVWLFYLHWGWLKLIEKVIGAKVNVQFFSTHGLHTRFLFSCEWKSTCCWCLHLYLLYFLHGGRLYYGDINHRELSVLLLLLLDRIHIGSFEFKRIL
jgi:hypothetical protein